MAINLIKTIQENLGYPALQKIDPNTDKPVYDDAKPAHQFSQAAISAIVTGFYKFVQADEGAQEFLTADMNTNWVSKIFSGNGSDVLQTVINYAGQTNEGTAEAMNRIATETVKVVKQNLPEHAGIKDVKTFFINQRNDILLYLPVELKMGELLHDNTLDDTTNKMEGPVSNLIKNIGNAFSNPVTGDEMKEQ